MNCARNCENLLNFVKVIPKTLLVPFFSGHGVVLMRSTNDSKGNADQQSVHPSNYFAPGGVQSIVMSISVCMSVCLYNSSK